MEPIISYGLITIGITGLIGIAIERIYVYHLDKKVKCPTGFEFSMGSIIGSLTRHE